MEVKSPSKKILFFDGHCNLCNGTIDFLMSSGISADVVFCSLQSDFAKDKLGRFLDLSEETGSVVFMMDGVIYKQTAAISAALKLMPFPWKALGFVLGLIPPFLSNPVYRWIAKNRYSWFGKRETCRLPEPHEKERFIC